ncbi:MAG TPA: hypothetical protein VFB36_08055 [Nevskiaceae bacterium]|nr:hypothetical protein [Nevskiaceae bacterium]
MNVRPSTRRKALLGIFRIRRKRKGGRLTAKELERAWHPTTGLRSADLRLALLALADAGEIAAHSTANGLVFELTWMGEQAMHKAIASLDDFGDWVTLLRARTRKSRRGLAALRRAEDTTAHAQ